MKPSSTRARDPSVSSPRKRAMPLAGSSMGRRATKRAMVSLVGHEHRPPAHLGVAVDELDVGGAVQREAGIPPQVVGLARIGHHRQPELALAEVHLQPGEPRGAIGSQRAEDAVERGGESGVDRARQRRCLAFEGGPRGHGGQSRRRREHNGSRGAPATARRSLRGARGRARRDPRGDRGRVPGAGQGAPPRHASGRRRRRRPVRPRRCRLPGAVRSGRAGPLRRVAASRRSGRPPLAAPPTARPGGRARSRRRSRSASVARTPAGAWGAARRCSCSGWSSAPSCSRCNATTPICARNGVEATAVVVPVNGERRLEFETRDGTVVRASESVKTGEEQPALGHRGAPPLRPRRSHHDRHRREPHRSRRHPLDRGGEAGARRCRAGRVRCAAAATRLS